MQSVVFLRVMAKQARDLADLLPDPAAKDFLERHARALEATVTADEAPSSSLDAAAE